MSVGFIINNSVKDYNIEIPFNPPESYPELNKFNFKLDSKNIIYRMIRDLFKKLKFDKFNINTPKWNPLSEIIEEGDQILIKPNFVKHYHPLGLRGVISQVTHASILRPIIDYVILALNGNGRIIIADTPLEKADFNIIIELNNTLDLIKFYKDKLDINVELYDLRTYKLVESRPGLYLGKRRKLIGSPGGYLEVDLKNNSELSELDSPITNYYTLADPSIDLFNVNSKKKGSTNLFHSKGKHIYKIPKIALDSNVIISVPKLKTHRMAGVTLNLKNMIGLCEKIYIPHHRRGCPPGGDAFSVSPSKTDIVKRKTRYKIYSYSGVIRISQKMLNSYLFKKFITPFFDILTSKLTVSEDWWGAWSGNDTLWRSIYDLNKILFYSDNKGLMQEKKQRNYFCLIDGIIGQEGEGPMTGKPKSCSLIIGGIDPVACDSFASHIMGYNINKLKVICKSKDIKKYKIGNYELDKFEILSNINDPLNYNLKFELPEGYRNIKQY